MISPEKNSLNFVPIYFVRTSNQNGTGIVYDLKREEICKEFNGSLSNFFGTLVAEYPEIATSIKLGLNDISSQISKSKKMPFENGYKNLHFVSNLAAFLTSKLLLAKKKGKTYKIGDCVTIERYQVPSSSNGQIYLLRKQKIGWDVLDVKVVQFGDPSTYKMNDFLNKNRITMTQWKDCFNNKTIFRSEKFSPKFTRQPTPTYKSGLSSLISSAKQWKYGPEVSTEDNQAIHLKNDPAFVYFYSLKYFETSGAYLAKVYNVRYRFNDYNCFIGDFVEDEFVLECGNLLYVLPTKFKRLPYTVKKKIRFSKCKNIQLFVYSHDMSSNNVSSMKKSLVFDTVFETKCDTAMVTLKMGQNKIFSGKIQSDNKNETPFIFGVPLNEFKDDRPRFIFGKDYCSVNYYKDGLLWKLEDANENEKIPFKISFDKDIYIGDAALKHPEFLMPQIHLGMISEAYNLNESVMNHDVFFVDESGECKIILNTVDGPRQTTPENILVIFMKSVIKLLEQQLLKHVEEIYFDVYFPGVSSLITIFPVIEKACEFLEIDGVLSVNQRSSS